MVDFGLQIARWGWWISVGVRSIQGDHRTGLRRLNGRRCIEYSIINIQSVKGE
jgi:hypothetical protein